MYIKHLSLLAAPLVALLISSVSSSVKETGLDGGIGEVTLSCTAPVTFTHGFTLTVTGSDGSSVEKSTTKAVAIERKRISRMTPIELSMGSEAPEPEAVDLGLPSGLKWAACNVGATTPEEYGDYFAWGETEPKCDNGYYWTNYRFRISGDSYSNVKFSKYVSKSAYGMVDSKTVLDPEDDVAHVRFGGNWRMPTDAEWTELRTECTWTWTSQNGVSGRLVTSNKNDNSIFLPAAGYRFSTNLYYAGSYGGYWSSSLYAGGPYRAWRVGIHSGTVYLSYFYRCVGHSVRPVSE